MRTGEEAPPVTNPLIRVDERGENLWLAVEEHTLRAPALLCGCFTATWAVKVQASPLLLLLWRVMLSCWCRLCHPLLQAEAAVLARMSDSELFIQLLLLVPFCLEQAEDQS